MSFKMSYYTTSTFVPFKELLNLLLFISKYCYCMYKILLATAIQRLRPALIDFLN